MSEARRLLATRPIRVMVALLVIAVLTAAGGLVPWVEAAYPLRGGAVARAVQYAGFAGVVTLLAVVALGAWVAPGWVAARVMRPDDRPAARSLRGTVLAFLLQPLVHAACLALGGAGMPFPAYRRLLLVLQGVLLVGAALVTPPATPAGSGERPRDRWLLLGAFALCMTILLLPAIAWVDFDSDGIELLVLGRSISARYLPTMWTGRLPGTDLGMFTPSYPIGWLVSIGGAGETAARLPVIGYAVAIALGVFALAEQKAKRTLTQGEAILLLLGVAAVVLTLAFNAAYSPYSTDIASPASIDLLLLVFLLAALYFVFEGATAWVVVSALLLALTRPTALLLFVLLAAAIFAVERDWRSPRLRQAIIAIAVAVLVSILHTLAVGGVGAASRARYLRFDDWSRVRYLLVPSGVVPALALFNWRRLDATSRELALLATAYFAFFHCMASYSLHHFAPAMLLPLVVLWREAAQREPRTSGGWRLSVALGAAVAISLALPRDFTVYRENRRIASTLAFEVGNYHGTFDEMQQAFTGRRAVAQLFASPFVLDAQAARVTDVFALMHYASNGDPDAGAQYIVRASSIPPPAGTVPQAARDQATLYVRDAERWARDRKDVPAPAPRSRFYNVPRSSLFEHLTVEARLYQLDLRAVFARIRALARGA